MRCRKGKHVPGLQVCYKLNYGSPCKANITQKIYISEKLPASAFVTLLESSIMLGPTGSKKIHIKALKSNYHMFRIMSMWIKRNYGETVHVLKG